MVSFRSGDSYSFKHEDNKDELYRRAHFVARCFGHDLKCDNCGIRLITAEAKQERCESCIKKVGSRNCGKNKDVHTGPKTKKFEKARERQADKGEQGIVTPRARGSTGQLF